MTGWMGILIAAEGRGIEFMGLQVPLVIVSAVTFLLLLIVLRFTAWPAIIKALDEREQRIQKRFDDGKQRIEAAEKKIEDYEARLRNIEDAGRKVIEEARKDAEVTAARIQKEAREEIARQVDRLRREIELARDKAADELQNQVVELSVTIVEKVLEEQVSEDEHRRFVDQCISQYESMKL